MKTVTYHCDYCNDLIPEDGEMIQLQSDSGINISNTFKLSKECKLNNWGEFHFCTTTCMKNMFLGVPKPTPAPATMHQAIFKDEIPPVPTAGVSELEIKSATEKPSEEFTSYFFFVDKESNFINAIKRCDFEDFRKEKWQPGYSLRNGKLSKPDHLSLSKNYLISENRNASISEVSKLISLMEENEPGLKVHFANPKL